jgi:hypothetical protein
MFFHARSNPVLDDEAKDLTTAIRAYGCYDHVTVRADRASSTSMPTRNLSLV